VNALKREIRGRF